MLKTLPYNALRTLESVVRLRGFGRAAVELNVTQSAVSQHVKQLEDWLGHPLVIRKSPQIVPTENGERLASATRDGFGTVSLVCDTLRDTKRTRSRGILVSAPPGFAFVWLLPRLLDFDEQHPDIPISLLTDPKSQVPASSDADVIISYSSGGFPGMHAEKLLSEMMSPVCTPEIAKTLHSVDDLPEHNILQDSAETTSRRALWDFWASETLTQLPHFPRTRQYGQANMVVQAAINGAGIAMGRSPLVYDAVKAGALVYPFADTAQSQSSYWFVCQHHALKSRSVMSFRSWIQHAVGQT
ncbi:MAG: LysR substrate-binding domain-containing protein [Roseobacter sp.]